jgi:hypothetical protein
MIPHTKLFGDNSQIAKISRHHFCGGKNCQIALQCDTICQFFMLALQAFLNIEVFQIFKQLKMGILDVSDFNCMIQLKFSSSFVSEMIVF